MKKKLKKGAGKKKRVVKKKPKVTKKKTKKHRYQRQKFPALNVAYQVANRRELLDMDYIDKLNDKEKEWLDRFLQETVITNFNHGGKNLIKDKETRRELYRDNNRRNSDVMSKLKTEGRLLYGGTEGDRGEDTDELTRTTSVAIPTHDGTTADQVEEAFLTAIVLKQALKLTDK